jgi:hypothetical protein
MKHSIKVILLVVLITAVFLITSEDVMSQCPMCRMSAESNLKDGGTEGKGLNAGILYMLSMPYLLVATLGYIWYRNRRKYTDAIDTEPFSDN